MYFQYSFLKLKYKNHMSLFENKIIERIRSTRKVDIYCGYGEYTKVSAYIIWAIYKNKRKFLFWDWYSYSYDVSVQYLKEPKGFVDKNIITQNNILKVHETEIKYNIKYEILSMKLDDKNKKN